MKIYTKTGDAGQTGLYRGGRVSKNSPRVEAYGTVDELNSYIGWIRSMELDPEYDAILKSIQNHLFTIGADLSTPAESVKTGDKVIRLEPNAQEYLEVAIDRMEDDLKPLAQFILPGGTPLASAIHIARSVCRRAERRVVGLASRESINLGVVIYLNRLSDFLFVLARHVNHCSGAGDVAWERPNPKQTEK
jgi:cob(I)alamin adenosyltransferase